MGLSVEIISFDCYNQLKNGKDFTRNTSDITPNLVGNIGETLRIDFGIKIKIFSNTTGTNTWNITYDQSGSPTIATIERSSGSFNSDGIVVGDKVTLYSFWANVKIDGGTEKFTMIVTFISDDGKIIKGDVTGGTLEGPGEVENLGLVVQLDSIESENTSAQLKFGLINNDESFNFLSKISNRQQIYYKADIDGTPTNMLSLGRFKDWVTGSVLVSVVSGVEDNVFKTQTFTFQHTIVLNPWYILDFRDNILNNTIPDILDGENSFKYAFEAELRKQLTDIRTSKIKVLQNYLGVTGWFNENFNGFNNLYEIESVAYEDADTTDPLDSVIINGRTKITIIVKKKTGSITSSFSAATYISYLPVSESEYTDTESDVLSNFIYKSEVLSNPDTTVGDLTSSIAAGKLTLEWIIEYSTLEKLKLSKDSEYLLWVQIEDSAISAGDSDRVALIADRQNYSDLNFVNNFITYTNYDFYTHELVRGVNTPLTTITNAINEDGISLESRFSIDTTKNVIINSITYKLVAYNSVSNTFFELDTYDLDISGAIIDGSGTQQFLVDTTRGYQLLDTDQFNLVELFTKELSGTDQFFESYIGQKLKWQDWLFNENVDVVFYDDTKENQNLNFKSSNYSGLNNYEIRLITVLNVSGNDDLGRSVTGDYIQTGGIIAVKDYNSGADITGIIETYDPDTLQSLGGAVLYNGKNTLFRATYTRTIIESIDYAIHRIEPTESIGDGIYELSSLYPFPSDNLLIPLAGETLLKVINNGTEIITECLIDGTKIQEGVNYKLSTRILTGTSLPSNAIQFEDNEGIQFESLDYIQFEN